MEDAICNGQRPIIPQNEDPYLIDCIFIDFKINIIFTVNV